MLDDSWNGNDPLGCSRAQTTVSSAKRRTTRKPRVADEQDANEETEQDPQGVR